METPLTPLDFARRTRRLHGGREAVVDGGLRLSYEQFFDRCDRWSSALHGLGVRPGERVATIAPNTHAQLESFYAVPQLGAVLVPVNHRLTPEDFVYIVNHSGASVVCADRDYLDAVDSVRDRMPDVRHFVAFENARDGWLDYEAAVAAASPAFTRPQIGERDLLTINYTSGTTARPKGVMITHRNAAINTIGTLLHLPVGVGERYLWTLPMFHANGWTYTWTVTAAAGTAWPGAGCPPWSPAQCRNRRQRPTAPVIAPLPCASHRRGPRRSRSRAGVAHAYQKAGSVVKTSVPLAACPLAG